MSLTGQQILIALIVAGYILGSIPFGLLVGFAKGVDVRKAGSGNIGASNVGRLLGKKFFFVVFFLDMLKGLVPMVIAASVVRRDGAGSGGYVLLILVGLATIFGHMFSVFLKFKGGKGVATSAGVLLGLWPYFTLPGVLTILTFIIALYFTRYISVGSIAAACSFPVFYLGMALRFGWDPLDRQLPLLIFALLMAVMIIYKHRSNIARLRAGTENRVGAKSKTKAEEPRMNTNGHE